jgi:hypothetical protein
MKQAFLLIIISAAVFLCSCTQKEWQCRCNDKVQSTHPYTKSFDLGKITGSEAKERCRKLGIITDSCRTIAL